VGDREVFARGETAFGMHTVVLGMGDTMAILVGTVRVAECVCGRRVGTCKSCFEAPAGVRGNDTLAELQAPSSPVPGGVGAVSWGQLDRRSGP
jgi:hypothetical protein